MDDKIVDAVTKTLRSGWITTGPQTKTFEKEITNYCGNKKPFASAPGLPLRNYFCVGLAWAKVTK